MNEFLNWFKHFLNGLTSKKKNLVCLVLIDLRQEKKYFHDRYEFQFYFSNFSDFILPLSLTTKLRIRLSCRTIFVKGINLYTISFTTLPTLEQEWNFQLTFYYKEFLDGYHHSYSVTKVYFGVVHIGKTVFYTDPFWNFIFLNTFTIWIVMTQKGAQK